MGLLAVLLIALVFAALLFGGRGGLSSVIGDAAKGIRAFRDGLKSPGGRACRVGLAAPEGLYSRRHRRGAWRGMEL
jgi:hypothetical protein